ncbi:hypothetical protein JCM8547_006156 [Rhodosporidiobolus lusitaniae]
MADPPTAGPSAGPPGVTAPSAPFPDQFMRFRLSVIDFVMSDEVNKYDNRRSPFSKDPLYKVPIIRIFGATDKGQRVAAHVHGAFPYIYIEYKGDLNPDAVNVYILKLGLSINHAMDLSIASRFQKKPGQVGQHVAHIVLCKGIPFYGYAVGYRLYLKIYTVNPKHQKRMSEILRSGGIMNTQFEVFEDHIPFLLQFLLDSNLYGCGWVDVAGCLFREGVPEHPPADSAEYQPPACDGPFAFRTYTTRTVPPDRLHPSPEAGGPEKATYEALEIDLPISQILNRRRLSSNDIHQDFIEKLYPDEVDQGRKVASVRELWTDEAFRRRARGEDPPQNIKDTKPRNYDKRPAGAPNFKSEPGYREKLRKRIEEDLKHYQEHLGGRGKKEPDFETFVDDQEKMKNRKTGWMEMVRTAFEQVDAVHVERFEEDEQTKYPFGAWAVKGMGLNISRDNENQWRRGGSVGIDVNVSKVKASQAASQAARIILKERAKKAKVQGGGEGGSDLDSEEEREVEEMEDEEDEDEAGRPPPTQAELLAQSQRRMDRAEQRAREYSADAQYEDDQDDDEEDNFFAFDFGTGRPRSEASVDSDDDASSVGSRLSSVSPTKSGYSSATALATDDEDSPLPKKRVKLEDGQQAPSPFSSPTKPLTCPKVPRTRMSRSPTLVNSPARGRVASASVTPTRRAHNNPFSSPDKPVAVRVAQPLSSFAAKDADEEAAPLFTFDMPLDRDETNDTAPQDSFQEAQPPQPAALPLEHFLEHSSPEDENEQRSSFFRSTTTPSQALAELESLPDDAFEEDYQPTPTLREEDIPSQLPPHLRSSSDLPRVDSGSEDEKPDVRPSPRFLPSPTPPQAEPEIVKEAPKPPSTTLKKRVAFRLTLDDIKADTENDSSQETTPTPVRDEEVRNSQTTTDSDMNPTPPQPRPRLDYPLSRNTFAFAELPPTGKDLVDSIESYKVGKAHLARVVHRDPYYSKREDIKKKHSYAGREFRIEGDTIEFLPPFAHAGRKPQPRMRGKRPEPPRMRRFAVWEFASRPPTLAQAKEWLRQNGFVDEKKTRFDHIKSQIEAPTQKAESSKFTATKGASQREKQHMAVLAMELHVHSRGKLLPNPQYDAIEVLFYCLQSDNDDLLVNGRSDNTHVGILMVGDEIDIKRKLGNPDFVVEAVENEEKLIERFVEKLRYDWDPECVAGFEVHHSSWGYLLERADFAYGWNLVPEFGRVMVNDTGKFGNAQSDRWGFNQSTTLKFSGREILPVWRILKADNKFQQNSFEHLVFHVLGLRTPNLSYKTLTEWFKSGDPALMSRVIQYWRNRVEIDIELLDAAEVVDQACESARVFGVDFNSVRTRGSQFKVESVMFKISKPESFMLLSPNRPQVGKQNAAECQPLIMEPISAFYKGPLVVLDFQSLYPSVMIGYNYCYSTCLGRVEDFHGRYKLGVSESDLPDGLLHLLKDDITISPNGIMFAKPHIRVSLLSKMLSELLDTRVMVKSSMKGIEGDKALMKLLNARQLALKFLANVTYGYTSATFSGRMPLVEIADSIVQTGRETLERAKDTVHANKEWGAEVVYGDTDSLFIYLPGKSKDDAFRIGNEIADHVTSINPRPIKLKFEKVYLPSVLLAKKRYVGWKYEHKAQATPDFDAKGIETVRRDGIPATQKILEKCLKLFFDNPDVSLVKSYCQRQWKKIIAGEVSPQDFTVAKKVKLGNYAEGRDPPPGAMVASRKMARDPRAEPEYGERVPYILTQSEKGTKQVNRAMAPEEFMADPRNRLDAFHYIEGMMIKPLERVFNLAGIDVKGWWREMSRSNKVHKVDKAKGLKPVLLDEHFSSDRCVACGNPGADGDFCTTCRSSPSTAIYTVQARKQALRSRQKALHDICRSCSDNPAHLPIACQSYDCPNLYARMRNDHEVAKLEGIDLEGF